MGLQFLHLEPNIIHKLLALRYVGINSVLQLHDLLFILEGLVAEESGVRVLLAKVRNVDADVVLEFNLRG